MKSSFVCVLPLAWFQTNILAAEVICLSGGSACVSLTCSSPPFLPGLLLRQAIDDIHLFSQVRMKKRLFSEQLHACERVFTCDGQHTEEDFQGEERGGSCLGSSLSEGAGCVVWTNCGGRSVWPGLPACWIRADVETVVVFTCTLSLSLCIFGLLFPSASLLLAAGHEESWDWTRRPRLLTLCCFFVPSFPGPLMLSEDGWHTVRGSDRRKQVHQQVSKHWCQGCGFCFFYFFFRDTAIRVLFVNCGC